MSAFNIRKILVPVDFSETSLMALEHATSMAKLYKASIILLHVFEDFVFSVDLPLSLAIIKEIEQYQNATENKLAELAMETQKKNSIPVTSMMTSGKPRSGIVSTAIEEDIDVIIMGTHGVSGLERIFIGSNTYRVISEAPCPVLAIQTPSGEGSFKRILLPVDSSFHSREKVKYAVDMAEKYGSKIIVSGMLKETDQPYSFNIKVNQVTEYLTVHKVPFETEIILTENYITTTLDQARKYKADLIVIMSEDESGPLGSLLSPYSQQIISQSKIAVMCIKPTENYVPFPTLVGAGF